MKDGKWLDLVESLALLGSGLGTIASIASQQLAFTAAPVSCLLLLNLANRRRLDRETLESANNSITHLDQRLSKDIKDLNQQIQACPSFADLATVRKTIQQRQDNAIAQLHHTVSSRLSAIERQDFDQLEQELAYLKTKYTQLSESIATVSQNLNRVVTSNRAENAENAIAALRQDVTKLELKVAHSSNQKHGIPRVLQDELYQIHRRLNSLPLPFDATALKQEVDGLVKIVGDLATRRDFAKLMAEIEKIRQQHQTLEQTVAPMRSVNAIMRKQMETLSTWITTGHPSSLELEKLQTTIAQLEARLETVPNNTEIQEQLNYLQKQFESVQKQTQNLDRQQQEWLSRLPEKLDTSALQNQIKYLTSRLEVTETQLSELVHNSKSGTKSGASIPDYELLFNLSQAQSDPVASTRAVLQEALRSAQSRIIVVFPYPDRATLDQELLQNFQAFLERGGRLDIGWGHLSDGQAIQQARLIYDRETSSIAKPNLKQMLQQLTQLKRNYPEQFRFKVLGTTENFLVCDSTYGVLGIHPIATASVAFPEIALGVRTQNQTVIQGLIDRFDHPVLDSNDITAYLNRAMTRHEMGDRRGAIDDYSTVLEIDVNHDIAYNNRALIHFELGNYADAIADLNQAVKSNSDIAYCNRGRVWAQIGEKNRAMEDFRSAIQIAPDFAHTYLQRGLAWMKFEHPLDAIDDFTTVIEMDTQNAVAYFHRGLARSKVSDKMGALRDLREAAWMFSAQGDHLRYQHAIAAINKLRKRFITVEASGLKLVREA